MAARKDLPTHGLCKHPLYKTWLNVKDRCRNPKNPYFHNYGGRGIKVCVQWEKSFVTFLQDVGEKPTPLHTLERKNNNGNYTPKNVVWATKKEQANNMRKNRMLTLDGRTQSLTLWAEEIGLVPSTLQYRLQQGMSVRAAISTPRRNGRRPMKD